MSGSATSGCDLEERHDAARQVAGDALAKEIGLAELERDAVEPHGLVERARLPAGIGRPRPTYGPAGSRRRRAAAPWPSMPCARSASGSPMPDSISTCGELITPPARITSRSARATLVSPPCEIFDADRAIVLEQHAGHQRIHLDVQVRPLHRRLQIGARGAAAPAVADRHLPAAEAFLLRGRCSRRSSGYPASRPAAA